MVCIAGRSRTQGLVIQDIPLKPTGEMNAECVVISGLWDSICHTILSGMQEAGNVSVTPASVL